MHPDKKMRTPEEGPRSSYCMSYCIKNEREKHLRTTDLQASRTTLALLLGASSKLMDVGSAQRSDARFTGIARWSHTHPGGCKTSRFDRDDRLGIASITSIRFLEFGLMQGNVEAVDLAAALGTDPTTARRDDP
jgi:hypothetical protein